MTETDTTSHDSIPKWELDRRARDSDPRPPLTHNQLLALQLKYSGKNYASIGRIINVPPDTVKGWFRRGTTVYGCYWRFAKEMEYQVSKDSLLILQQGLGEAVETVRGLVADPKVPSAIRLRASMFVIETLLPRIDAQQEKIEAEFTGAGNLIREFRIKDWNELEKYLLQWEMNEDYII